MSTTMNLFDKLSYSFHTIHLCYVYRNKRYDKILLFLLGILSGVILCRVLTPEPLIREVPTEVVKVVYKDPDPIYQDEATQAARILYGLKDFNLSEKAKLAVLEVIMNRASYGTEFPTTLMGVINQENQWQGYVPDGNYLDEDYQLAFNKFNDRSGSRIIPDGCYFLRVTQGKVYVRDKWDGTEWPVA